MINSLLEAARWAPSSSNKQPWVYLIFDGRVAVERDLARDCLTRGNGYARYAPVLIMAIAEEISSNGKKNAKALHDLGLANENLLLQAISLGLNCRPMGGFDADKARQYFSIPEGYSPIIMIAIGYPAALSTLPPDIREKEEEPRVRKPIYQFSYLGSWSKALPTDAAE